MRISFLYFCKDKRSNPYKIKTYFAEYLYTHKKYFESNKYFLESFNIAKFNLSTYIDDMDYLINSIINSFLLLIPNEIIHEKCQQFLNLIPSSSANSTLSSSEPVALGNWLSANLINS